MVVQLAWPQLTTTLLVILLHVTNSTPKADPNRHAVSFELSCICAVLVVWLTTIRLNRRYPIQREWVGLTFEV